ncbi:MAG: hypothetical protein KDD82_29860, partial [Planctomycetes bacterium]|nr:hypothetical protein [Planctomycetota bacterium]
MVLRITCPCGAPYTLGDHLAGRTFKCPACQVLLKVGAPAGPPPGGAPAPAAQRPPQAPPQQQAPPPAASPIPDLGDGLKLLDEEEEEQAPPEPPARSA